MFEEEYVFKGKHSKMVNKLTEARIFKTNYDIYRLAPIIGYFYSKKALKDNSSKETSKIFADKIMRGKKELMFNYRLIILSDKKNEPDLEKRVEKAFKELKTEESEKDELLYDSYVLGGLEKLHNSIFEDATESEEYLVNLHALIYEIKIKNTDIDNIDICELGKD